MRSSREFFVKALRRPLKQFETGTPVGRARKTWSKNSTAAVAYLALLALRLPGFWEGRHPLPRSLDNTTISKNLYQNRPFLFHLTAALKNMLWFDRDTRLSNQGDRYNFFQLIFIQHWCTSWLLSYFRGARKLFYSKYI